MDYNLGELDADLSAGTNGMDGHGEPPNTTHSGGVVRTNTRRGSVVTLSGTRRGSLKGRDDAFSRAGLAMQRHTQFNLFHFELRELAKQLLLQRGETCASYHEYAVYSPPEHDKDGDYRTPSLMASGAEGLQMLQRALRHGYGLDDQGKFVAKPPGKPRLQGRVRQFIVDRLARPNTANADGLHMKAEDFEALDLHAATLPSIQRVTTECSFWNVRKDTLYIVFSFSANPQPPYDFLSMSYNLKTRITTALVRRSFDTRWHDEEALNEYEQRLNACQELWGHPLVLPIVLLQVQLLRTEEAVLANNEEVLELEGRVDDLTGKPRQAPPKFRRRPSSRSDSLPGPLKRLSTFKDFVEEKVSRRGNTPTTPTSPSPIQIPLNEDYMPPQTIHLMKEAHDVLKGAIQLLDTLRWMERAVKLLIQTGDELHARTRDLKRAGAESGKGDEARSNDEDGLDDLSLLWHEIKQYLESIWRLCTALETDRRMSELRCRAQIDIIYSKMAQEDNNLNARMAVASTRDSSSMKALAVITAIFLPGEYMSSLFGQSFFNWEYGTRADPALGGDAPPDTYPNPVIMPLFWVYWAFTIPLTIVIIVLWRAWWVNQDRFFRRHLSPELSNERYWTTDGKPRELETSFMQDMLSVFRRSGGGSTTNSTVLGTSPANNGRPSPVSRRSTFESDNIKHLGPGSPGCKDSSVTDVEDWEGPRKRTRTISFAMRTEPREPPSAV